MKPSLQVGINSTVRFEVTRERTVDFMGEQARVYATPMLVRDIEVACRELLFEHLDAGEDSVGTRVEIDHLAATPLGMQVTLELKLVGLSGRAAQFTVQGRDDIEPICRGHHHRFIVEVATTEKRLVAKAAKVTAARLT